jgi:hypothetical protein
MYEAIPLFVDVSDTNFRSSTVTSRAGSRCGRTRTARSRSRAPSSDAFARSHGPVDVRVDLRSPRRGGPPFRISAFDHDDDNGSIIIGRGHAAGMALVDL